MAFGGLFGMEGKLIKKKELVDKSVNRKTLSRWNGGIGRDGE
jgi:hypothetical protein